MAKKIKIYSEFIKEDLARQLEFTNVNAYRDLGYDGKGITILNHESESEHSEITRQVLTDYVPGATILDSYIYAIYENKRLRDCYIVVDNNYYDFGEAVDYFNIKIVTASLQHSVPEPKLKYLRKLTAEKGLILVCAAGNQGTEGVTGIYASGGTAITAGAVRFKDDKIERLQYSGVGQELDFCMFMGRGTGTSSSSPALAAIIALLLQRYGDFNQEWCIQILKSICMDLSGQGRDDYYGWGLPILPLCDRLPLLDKLREEKKMSGTNGLLGWLKSIISRYGHDSN